MNLRVLKDFRLSEKYRLQLSAEMFNLFNWENVIIGSAATNALHDLRSGDQCGWIRRGTPFGCQRPNLHAAEAAQRALRQ